MPGVPTLERMADTARMIPGIWSHDVQVGDWIILRTKNSVYSLATLGQGRFQVAGGWFTHHGADGAHVQVLGCTWGGRAILTELVAAPGMFVEFDNGVRTTRVREVRVLRGAGATH